VLTDYFRVAMRQAKYEILEENHFIETIPPCRGCWAEGVTLEACRDELQSTLEDWVLVGLQLGNRLPIIDGMNLNPTRKTRKAARAKAKKV
jgi:predicted RNase H-like HicB family nuclease